MPSKILQAIAAARARVHADTTAFTPEEHELMGLLEQLNARRECLNKELALLDEQGNAAMREVERQLALRHSVPLEQVGRVCVHWDQKPYRWHLLPATIVEIPADGPPRILHELGPGQLGPAEANPPEWAKELAEKIARGEEP